MSSLFAFVFTFIMTVVIGAPVAARLARLQVWLRPASPDALGNSKLSQHVCFFEPVDFGPDTMQWPSEVERRPNLRPAQEWPSAKWDDTHFGKGASATARAQFKAAKATSEQTRGNNQAEGRAADAEHRAKGTRARQHTEDARSKAKAVPSPQRRPKAKAHPKPKQPQTPFVQPPVPTKDPKDPAGAIEGLVAERGLAGAVQFLMQQNGWDFRTAASFVANNRKR